MKFYPILFSTEMVQAILEGRKKMTRRVIKPQPTEDDVLKIENWDEAIPGCPYGKAGDVLWVRETWAPIMDLQNKKALPGAYCYREDLDDDYSVDWRWKPSIYMPKAACRLFLQIESIRVERLQDITVNDARAEGVKSYKDEVIGIRYKDYMGNPALYGNPEFDFPTLPDAKKSFESLWHSINGDESWNTNPWVWVISFKRIDKPENFK